MTSKKLNTRGTVLPSETAPASFEVTKSDKDKAKEKLERYMKEELRMVKGIFQNFETPGMALDLQLKKYKGHFFKQILKDGEECEVPLYVARHLNGIDVTAEAIGGKIGSCSYPVHSHIMDKDGNYTVSCHVRKKRFGFQSMEFAGAA